jgi:hypothetical protein
VLDSGVESGLFWAPLIPTETGTLASDQVALSSTGISEIAIRLHGETDELHSLLPNALPIPDHDHALHHVLLCVETCFGWKDTFKSTLSAMSLYFNSRDRCDRFTVEAIYRNPNIPAVAKNSIAGMFKRTCPRLMMLRCASVGV